jgi:hypothetical protein
MLLSGRKKETTLIRKVIGQSVAVMDWGKLDL